MFGIDMNSLIDGVIYGPMRPLPTDVAPPARSGGVKAWWRRCLSRCVEAWVQRQNSRQAQENTPPAPPLPLYWLHINEATARSRLEPGRKWWARMVDRWRWK